MDNRGYIRGRAAFQERFETGDKHRDILGDGGFITGNLGSRESRTDDFASVLTVTGESTGTEDGLNLALVAAEVIEIAFLDGFIEAVDGVEAGQAGK